MSPLKIRLFGKFSLIHDNREFECLPSAKAKELFCYLLLHRDRHHLREIVASQLWGNYTTAQSRKNFRQTLWQLQQALHSLSSKDQIHPVQVDGEYLRLHPEADIWLDIAVFERAFTPVRGITGEQIQNQQAQILRNAVSLYSGDLLEGWFQDWCLYHRERLQSIYLAMLDKLMAYCEFHHEYEDGLSFGERLLHQDNARERTYFRLMRLHYLAGDRAGALRQFHRCASALETELGVKPSKRTLELYEQLRTDRFDPPASAQVETGQSLPAKPESSSYFPRLKRIRSLLLKLQDRVDQDLREVDQALATHVSRPPSGKH
jgi:DNA-binding SARP family transcriptional activator